MTFTKTLKETTKNVIQVQATENYDKFSSAPYYQIVVAKEGDPRALYVIDTARSTWRRKLKQTVEDFC